MGWNNATERKKFESEQKKQAEEYRKLGMKEDQIIEMYEFDLEQFNRDRRYAIHIQPMLSDEVIEEDKSEMFEKFSDSAAETIFDSPDKSRYWWVEEIGDPMLYERIKTLSAADLELLTLIIFDGFTQEEIAEKYGVSQSAISQRMTKIKNILKTLIFTL